MRVLIVDDNNAYRNFLREALKGQQDLTLVAEAPDGEEGIRLAQQFKPDVILMDIDMPGINGFQATRRIKEQLASATVLILSALEGQAYRDRAAECGATAYLPKTTPILEILGEIRRKGLRHSPGRP